MMDWNQRKGRADKKITISEQEYFNLKRDSARWDIAVNIFENIPDGEYSLKEIDRRIKPIY